MRKLFIYGFPGLYGGAATELHHQIHAWQHVSGVELAIVPTMSGYKNEPLFNEMRELGVEIYSEHDFSAVTKDDAVINFCSSTFLENLPKIRQFTSRTIFVNCMTFLFKKEKQCHIEGLISHSLYQREGVRVAHEEHLRVLGSRAEFLEFVPYFNAKENEYSFDSKDSEFFHIGRISRDAEDKYTHNLSHIYQGIISPKLKRGHLLGFGPKGQSVVGQLPEWIKGYINHNKFSVKDFYKTVDIIVQPTRTTENWPRIGFEAMYSGVPLVVDNRGGWQTLIEHGVSGYLCNHERDFMYYASKLAYEPDTRERIADAAYHRARELSSIERSVASWQRVFERVFN